MPLYKKISTESYEVYVWKVTETYDELLAVLPHSDIFRDEAERRFTSMKRRMEFAAVRALLYVGAGIVCPQVGYMPSGKPFLLRDSRDLSISHTMDYVAVMLAENGVPGIDIERRSDRVLRIRSRIVGDQERAETADTLLLHWSAKESVYKIIQCEEVDFVRHLRLTVQPGCLESITNELKKTGEAVMETFHPDCITSFVVHYLLDDDFVLTYSVWLKKTHQNNLCDDNPAEHG